MAAKEPTKLTPSATRTDEAADGLTRPDLLEFEPVAFSVAEILLGSKGPLTIGITAKWGTGKTSMLKLIRGAIDGQENKNIQTIWFNAWKYDREPEPIVPLLVSIHQATADPKNKGVEAVKTIGKSARAVASGIKLKGKIGTPFWVQLLTGFHGELEVETEPGKTFDKLEELLKDSDIPTIEESAVASALRELESKSAEFHEKENAPKFIVFIDDLDRCHPDSALRLLDAIKLVLDLPGFLFVLALDKTIIEEFLIKRYRREFGASNYEESGRRYIDKIIQLEVPLPPQTGRHGGFVDNTAIDIVGDDLAASIAAPLKLCTALSPRDIVRLMMRVKLDLALFDRLNHKIKPLSKLVAENRESTDVRKITRPEIATATTLLRLIEFGFESAKRADFNQLVGEPVLCRELWNLETNDPFRGEGNEEGLRAGIDQRLRAVRGLRLAIKTHGELLLSHEDLRRRLVESLNFKEEQPQLDKSTDQYKLFAQAVRIALDLGPEASFEGRLDQVKSLFMPVAFDDGGMPFVARCIYLTSLSLNNTQVSDVGPLEKLTNLTQLSLRNTQVSDVKPLEKLTNLTELDLMNTQVSNVKPLEKLTNLTKLDLMNTQVSDVKPLEKLTNLTWLDLYDTRVSNVKPLEKLTNLTTLNLRKTQVSGEQADKLKRLLPGCQISHRR